MFKKFRDWCERFLRIPGDPEPPPGDEARTQRFRAAPNYYKYLLAMWAIKTAGLLFGLVLLELGPLVAVFGTRLQEKHLPAALILGLPQLIIFFFLIGRLISGLLVKLDFEKRWYLVTDRSLRLREGIVHVNEMTITFANIQNISISQGPIQRALKIADLRVDTAGGANTVGRDQKTKSQHTAFFRGVDNANAIRELIQARLRELKDSGLGDTDEATGREASRSSNSEIAKDVLPVLREIAQEATALREAAA